MYKYTEHTRVRQNKCFIQLLWVYKMMHVALMDACKFLIWQLGFGLNMHFVVARLIILGIYGPQVS